MDFASAPSASPAAVLGACTAGAGFEPLSQTLLTLLTVLTVFSSEVRILITRFPARPSRLKAMSMPSARRNVWARRKCPARARGFLSRAAPVLPVRSRLARRRSAALPVQELRLDMSSRTNAAIGSASIMLSIAALRLAAYARAKVPVGHRAVSQAVAQTAKSAIR